MIDTNVPVVANAKGYEEDSKCIRQCVDALERARKSIILLDDRHRILNEYLANLSLKGQPGAGDAFFRWLWDNQVNRRHCRTVTLTPKSENSQDFEEFPREPSLAAFDYSDRKFVAVACASDKKARVLEATDSGWWEHREQLRGSGVSVDFLCPWRFEGTKAKPTSTRSRPRGSRRGSRRSK